MPENNNDQAQRRYPGPVPFSEAYTQLFFGREEEIASLANIIKTNPVAVLFGRSGFGKSSLIDAGLCPVFEKKAPEPLPDGSAPAAPGAAANSKEKPFKIIKIRFGINPAADNPTLQEQFVAQLYNQLEDAPLFMSVLNLPEREITAWQVFKSLQWKYAGQYSGILLILDQFEQVFNAPPGEFRQLAVALSEVAYNRVPLSFDKALSPLLTAAFTASPGQEPFEPLKEQLELLKHGIPAHLLIGIRSDKLYLLDELGDDIPVIFSNRYRLRRLPPEKLEEVMFNPAMEPGRYDSRPFMYSAEAVEKVREFLMVKQNNRREVKVETFLLQIICQKLEERAIEKQRNNEKRVILKAEDVGNLTAITKHYYQQIFSEKPGDSHGPAIPFNKYEALQVRFLVERKLINEKTMSRICLDKTFINSLGFDETLLRKLTDTRIVRRELNTVSGESYELSHDAFIKPILEVAQHNELGSLNDAVSTAFNELLNNIPRPDRARTRKLISEQLLDREGNLLSIRLADTDRDRLLLNEMIDKKVMISIDNPDSELQEPGSKSYLLNEVYQDAAIQMADKDTGRKQQRRYKQIMAVAATILLLLLLVQWVARVSWRLYYRENAFNVAIVNLPLRSDNDTVKAREQIYVLREAFERLKKEPGNYTGIVGNKLVEIFNNNGFLGNKLFIPGKTVDAYKAMDAEDVFLVTYIHAEENHANGKYPSPGTFGQPAAPSRDVVLYMRQGQGTYPFNKVEEAGFVRNTRYLYVRKDSAIAFYAIEKQGAPRFIESWKLNLDGMSAPQQQEVLQWRNDKIEILKYIPYTAAYIYTEGGGYCLSRTGPAGISGRLCLQPLTQHLFFNSRYNMAVSYDESTTTIGYYDPQLQPRGNWKLPAGATFLPPFDPDIQHIFFYSREQDGAIRIYEKDILSGNMKDTLLAGPFNRIYCDQQNNIVVNRADSILFLDQQLSPIALIPAPEGRYNKQLLSAIGPRRGLLNYQGQSLYLHRPGEGTDSVNLPEAIRQAYFSPTGDTIYAQSASMLYFLDRQLKLLHQLQCDLFHNNSLVFKNYAAYLLLADLRNEDVQRVNASDPESISQWIDHHNRQQWQVRDTAFKTYRLETRGFYSFILKKLL